MTMGVMMSLLEDALCLTDSFMALMHEEGFHRDVVCGDTGYGYEWLVVLRQCRRRGGGGFYKQKLQNTTTAY